MCVCVGCFKSKIQTQKEKLYRSIHFNYTRRGGINAAARDHRLGELKKVNCYSFTSNDTFLLFQHIQFKKKKLGGDLHTSAHTLIHTHKQNQQKEGVGYFTQQSRREKKRKNKGF